MEEDDECSEGVEICGTCGDDHNVGQRNRERQDVFRISSPTTVCGSHR